MKQFTLEEYLKNPKCKIVTRDRKRVRIICTDRAKTDCPVVALVMRNDGHEDVEVFSEDGRWIGCGENSLDLFFAPNKHTGWINLYRTGSSQYKCGSIHESEQDAKRVLEGDSQYVSTIKVEWEE